MSCLDALNQMTPLDTQFLLMSIATGAMILGVYHLILEPARKKSEAAGWALGFVWFAFFIYFAAFYYQPLWKAVIYEILVVKGAACR